MKHTFLIRSFLLSALLLGMAACSRETPDSDPTPEAQATNTVTIQQDPTAQGGATPGATATALPSPAEQAKARKETISAALSRMEMPEEGDVVATVNGEDITVSQLQAYMRLRMEGLASQYYIDWEQADVDALVGEVQAEVLEQLIEMTLISQGAADAEIVVDEAELAGVVHEVQTSIVDSQGYADWQDYLDTMDLDDEVVTDILRQSLLVNQMVLAQDVPAEAEQVHARHILVTDEALATDLLAQLSEGADFAELATANSEDPGSAQSGGDLGWFPRGIMVTEFDGAAFALEVGELSDAVPTTYGYHIIEVLEKETRELTPVHTQQLQQVAFMDWLQTARMESEIQWYVLEAVG